VACRQETGEAERQGVVASELGGGRRDPTRVKGGGSGRQPRDAEGGGGPAGR
jgi:hypothetical protein